MKVLLRTRALHASSAAWKHMSLPPNRLVRVRYASAATGVEYNARLQRTVEEHAAIVFPEGPRVAQVHYERQFPVWKKEQVALHKMREAHAMTILRKYANEGAFDEYSLCFNVLMSSLDLLWQEARDLNATQNHDAVINVLYRVLYVGKADAPWLPSTTSLFAQQLVLAAVNANDAQTAVEAVGMLAALPSHAVSRKVLVDACHSAAQLCLQQPNEAQDNLSRLLTSIQRSHVSLDNNLSEQVLKALLRKEDEDDDATTIHLRIVDLYNSGALAPSLEVSTRILRSLLFIQASSSDDSIHHQLTELYGRMRSEFALSAPDVGNYLLSTSCSADRTAPTDGHVASAVSFMRLHRLSATVPTVLEVVAALLASEPDAGHEVWDVLFDEQNAAVFPWTSQHVSAAVSAAAIHGHSGAAMVLVEKAQSRHLPLLDVTYGHVVATASDPRLRAAFVQMYKAANQGGEVVVARQEDPSHVGFQWSGALLQHVAQQREQPVHDLVLMLLQEMQYYNVEATEQDMAAVLSTLTGVTLYELYESFPRVIKNAPHAWAAAIQARLRASTAVETMQDAMQVWRCFVWTEGLRLDESVFATICYSALRRPSTAHFADEVLAQYSARNNEQQDTLVQEALVRATDAADLPTTRIILRKWTQSTTLTYDAVTSVFRTVEQVRETAPKPIREEVPPTLSYFGMMVEFPGLFPLDATVLSQALVLSAQADLFYDCQALLTMAAANAVELSPEAQFACVELLTRTKEFEAGDRERLLHTVRRQWQQARSPKESFAGTIEGLR